MTVFLALLGFGAAVYILFICGGPSSAYHRIQYRLQTDEEERAACLFRLASGSGDRLFPEYYDGCRPGAGADLRVACGLILASRGQRAGLTLLADVGCGGKYGLESELSRLIPFLDCGELSSGQLATWMRENVDALDWDRESRAWRQRR